MGFARWTRALLAVGLLSPSARGQDGFDWSGFAILRAASKAPQSLEVERASAQVQAALDWSSPAGKLRVHTHLVARTNDDGTRHGAVGVAEAYLEANLPAGRNLFRLRGGALFLPTSRENVDALWENPFTISSSGLNTWFGEELRPVGLDASWRGSSGATLGGTVFRGNDTFGALPPARGFPLRDDWILLGQTIGVDYGHSTSATAETDGRLGWSGRVGWTGRRGSLLFTHLDNRSDGLEYGRLFNWNTRFELIGADCSLGRFTLAGETGWGPTFLIVHGRRIVSDLRASYLLISAQLPRGRASLRLDAFDNGETDQRALTLAYFWTTTPRLTTGAELVVLGEARRALLQVRYAFGR